MDENIEEIKKSAKIHSDELAILGTELTEIGFNYKVLDKTESKYWEDRLEKFKNHHKKGMEYYNKAHLLMNLVEKENAGMFLLSISKLHQLGQKLLDIFEEVKKNPNAMSSKDKQQSKWSKDLREQLIELSDKCLAQEKDMNLSFREFYEKHLKEFLEK